MVSLAPIDLAYRQARMLASSFPVRAITASNLPTSSDFSNSASVMSPWITSTPSRSSLSF